MKTIAMLVVAFASLKAIPKHAPEPVPKTDREKILAVASTQVGIVEKTGKNDGEVEKYIASVGLNPKGGYPYCAAFNYWVGEQALDVSPYPKSAWSPDHVRGGQRVSKTTVIKGGECFGIWNKARKRIAHTGLLESFDGKTFITVEANTSANAAVGSEADRDGQGVYRKRRHHLTVHSVKDWIK